ncbi:MAG: AAA family ATPase [Pirellulaceae bacterium]
MYESFFDFDERPFAATPRTERYFPAAAIEQARQTLVRTVERAAGPGLLVGSAGTGKTLLCRMLAEHFHDRFRVAMLACARLCTRRALLQSILFELGLPYRNMEEGELRLALIDHLEPSDKCPHGMLLLVDEAHVLPLRLLDEIRMITNLVRDGAPRVQLVLAGNSLIEERFASPKLESFNQRLAARCYLEPLNREETAEYVRAQVRAVGGAPESVFAEDALRAVFQATDGIPRLINQVCDHALMLASVGGCTSLDSAGIEEAWADLQQLPTPWQPNASAESGAEATGGASVVEFGQLDELDAEPSESTSLPGFEELAPLAEESMAAGEHPMDPIEQIEQIEQQVEAVQNDEDFQPAGSIGPEVELVFHGPHDPFAQPFDEEEVVIDRFSSLDHGRQGRRPRVSSVEGRELAAAMAAASINDPPPGLSIAEDTRARGATGHARRGGQAAAERSDFDPADDRVMPVQQEDLPAVASDDSDLIVVEDGHPLPPAAAATGSGRARRQEYRQLFAKLRQG